MATTGSRTRPRPPAKSGDRQIASPAPTPAPTLAPERAPEREPRRKMGAPTLPPEESKMTHFHMRCRNEYREWMKDFADQTRVTPAILIDQALMALALERGFEPPPRR